MDPNPITAGLDLNYSGRTTNLASTEWTDRTFSDLANNAIKYRLATQEEAETAVSHFINIYLTGSGIHGVTQCLLILFHGARFHDDSTLVPQYMVGNTELPALEAKGWSEETGYCSNQAEGVRLMAVRNIRDFLTGLHDLEANERILLVTFIAFTCFRCCVKEPADVILQLQQRTIPAFIQITGHDIVLVIAAPRAQSLTDLGKIVARSQPSNKRLMMLLVSSVKSTDMQSALQFSFCRAACLLSLSKVGLGLAEWWEKAAINPSKSRDQSNITNQQCRRPSWVKNY